MAFKYLSSWFNSDLITGYSVDGSRAGIVADVSFWVVLDHLAQAGNAAANGTYKLEWEESFYSKKPTIKAHYLLLLTQRLTIGFFS